MTAIVWGDPADKKYEHGLDRGVLYLPDSSVVSGGVPWNGLISLTENSLGAEIEPIYFDGVKVLNITKNTQYKASLRAFSYPKAFEICMGFAFLRPGVFISGQKPTSFGLTYRTKVNENGYKIHILYNVIAGRANVSSKTNEQLPNLSAWEWILTATPQEFSTGYIPTAHMTIDSTKVNPVSLASLEDILYGSSTTEATLPSQADIRALF